LLIVNEFILTFLLIIYWFNYKLNNYKGLMFRKLWKTIKIFSVLIIILICLPHSILPKQLSGSRSQDIDEYIKLNESETRLSEYKDDTEALKLKLAQLEVINISR